MSTAVKYSWNQHGLLSNITNFNKENKLIQGSSFSYDWNGKVTLSRLPQGDSAVLVFDEKAKIIDIVGESYLDVRFENVEDDDEVVQTIRQGNQVRDPR